MVETDREGKPLFVPAEHNAELPPRVMKDQKEKVDRRVATRKGARSLWLSCGGRATQRPMTRGGLVDEVEEIK